VDKQGVAAQVVNEGEGERRRESSLKHAKGDKEK
jgi:hypothetical protein